LQRFFEQRPDAEPNDVAYSLTATRASFDHRAVVVGADRDELSRGLAAIASSAPAPHVVTGKVAATGGTVFIFPGQGSQWTGMASELLDTAPAFADQMRLCDTALAEFVTGRCSRSCAPVSVLRALTWSMWCNPCVLRDGVAGRQWRALGIQPDAVLGYSQGEIAAAYVAGALVVARRRSVVTLRSKAICAIAGIGGMVSILRPIQQVHALIEPWAQSISVAAQNGPSSTVVTGNAAALMS
jgi:polyketide synthase 12